MQASLPGRERMTMVDLAVLPTFVVVMLLFLVPPGPDMAYMLAVGLQGGRWAAVKAILGIGTGMSIYAAAVVVGLGKLAQSHPLLLELVKLVGAAYLSWMAFTTIRAARTARSKTDEISTGRWYLRGALVAVTNPKIILFYIAVLPGFTGNAQNTVVQFALLGAVNVVTEVLLYGGIGMLAGTFHSRFSGGRNGVAALNYVAGAVYLALASVIAAETVIG